MNDKHNEPWKSLQIKRCWLLKHALSLWRPFSWTSLLRDSPHRHIAAHNCWSVKGAWLIPICNLGNSLYSSDCYPWTVIITCFACLFSRSRTGSFGKFFFFFFWSRLNIRKNPFPVIGNSTLVWTSHFIHDDVDMIPDQTSCLTQCFPVRLGGQPSTFTSSCV